METCLRGFCLHCDFGEPTVQLTTFTRFGPPKAGVLSRGQSTTLAVGTVDSSLSWLPPPGHSRDMAEGPWHLSFVCLPAISLWASVWKCRPRDCFPQVYAWVSQSWADLVTHILLANWVVPTGIGLMEDGAQILRSEIRSRSDQSKKTKLWQHVKEEGHGPRR